MATQKVRLNDSLTAHLGHSLHLRHHHRHCSPSCLRPSPSPSWSFGHGDGQRPLPHQLECLSNQGRQHWLRMNPRDVNDVAVLHTKRVEIVGAIW